MEHYINIIFNKKITLGKVEETVNSVASLGNVPLNEDGLEYEIFKENNNFGISIPLINHIEESKVENFVNKIAENLFDKGFNNFDIELSLNEATRLTTFEPWRREIEAAGYTISPSGTNIRSRDGSGTVAGINDNGNLWSGSETITRIVRGNNNTAAPADNNSNATQEITGTDALQQFAQSDQRGIANNPEQRTAITQLQQRLIDLGYDLGPMGADGIYGRRTIAAVRAYQEANELTVDGDAGPETIGHILRNAGPGRGDGAAEVDRRRQDAPVNTTMSDEEALQEFIRLVNEQNWREALAIADAYPAVRRRITDENYERLRQAAQATPTDAPTDEPADTPTDEPTDAPSDTPGATGYRVRGDLVIGRDTVTSNGRRINKQWELNTVSRELTIIGSPNTYVNVHVVRRQGTERIRTYVEQRNNFVLLNAEFVNLLEAIKENIENYTTALPMDNGRVERPSDEPTDTPSDTAPQDPTAGTPTDPAQVATADLAQSDNSQIAQGADMIAQGRDDDDIDAIAQGVTVVVDALPGIASPQERADRAEQIVAAVTNTELQNPRVRAALASQQLAIAMAAAEDEDEIEDALRQFVRDVYPEVVPPSVRDRATPAMRFEATVRRAQDEGMMSAFVDPNRAVRIIQDEINQIENAEDETAQDTPPEETPTGREGDGGLAIARDAIAITREIYLNLGNNITGAGTDEEAIQAALERIQNERMWNIVVGTYARRYPNARRLRTGQLLGDLRNALSRRDWRRYVQPELDRLGVEEDYNGQVTAARAEEPDTARETEIDQELKIALDDIVANDPKITGYNIEGNTVILDIALDQSRWEFFGFNDQNKESILEKLPDNIENIEYNEVEPATNESVNTMKINDIVYEETYDGDDFFEEYGVLWYNEDEELDEAEYQGRKVKLGKPMKGDVKKFKVYVKKPNGNVVKVNFGDPNMRIKKSNPARRRSFRARHNCDNPGPRWKARYWSCRKW